MAFLSDDRVLNAMLNRRDELTAAGAAGMARGETTNGAGDWAPTAYPAVPYPQSWGLPQQPRGGASAAKHFSRLADTMVADAWAELDPAQAAQSSAWKELPALEATWASLAAHPTLAGGDTLASRVLGGHALTDEEITELRLVTLAAASAAARAEEEDETKKKLRREKKAAEEREERKAASASRDRNARAEAAMSRSAPPPGLGKFGRAASSAAVAVDSPPGLGKFGRAASSAAVDTLGGLGKFGQASSSRNVFESAAPAEARPPSARRALIDARPPSARSWGRPVSAQSSVPHPARVEPAIS
jgi:hypothetical protein